MIATLTFPPTPTGLEAYSPGLARSAYPGFAPGGTNPERVEANLRHAHGDAASTLTGLGRSLQLPRVVATRQPWAIWLAILSGLPIAGRQVMSRDQATIRAERAELRKQYKALYDKLSALLFRHDPIGIKFKDNSDEYEPEVGIILPRLEHGSSEADCLKVIHEEFRRWFGDDIAGPISKYEPLAREAWIMWNDEKLN
jgi:hypothetical protein